MRDDAEAQRRGIVLALVLFASLVVACARAEESPTRALHELERLTFVPPFGYELPNYDLTLERAIVVDRYEFTRADLRHYWSERATRADGIAWSEDAANDAPERADWPAFMDYFEAVELAGARGMRLPTPREWLHVAVGRNGYQQPWGGSGREFFANTLVLQDRADFSLNSPCNVGTFENGRSRPFGCYDLLGNVWEWVDGIVLESIDSRAPYETVRDELDDRAGTMTSVLGGAYNTPWRPTFELDRSTGEQRFHARRVDKRTLGPAFGVRMCADAAPYLAANASRWGTSAPARARIRAVGRAWAGDALARAALRPMLAELRAAPGSAPALAWLEEGVLAEP